MESKSLTLSWTTVYANSDVTPLEQPLTGWFPCGNFENARATVELRGASHSDLEVRIALQFADFADQSSMTVKALGATYISTDGITYPDSWELIADESKANQMVRVLAEVRLKDATPGGFQAARLSGRVDLKTC
jgi:hypothetical protein